MLKIKIIYIGKTKEQWIQEGIAEFEKRLTGDIALEWQLLKNDQELETVLSKEQKYTCLDPTGTTHTSESFSSFITKTANHTFVIGGPEGIPPHLKKNNISFSKMTFTHQMIRLLLLEQLYRGIQIYKNTPYHK